MGVQCISVGDGEAVSGEKAFRREQKVGPVFFGDFHGPAKGVQVSGRGVQIRCFLQQGNAKRLDMENSTSESVCVYHNSGLLLWQAAWVVETGNADILVRYKTILQKKKVFIKTAADIF